jgi:regulator of sigma E protease
LSILLAILSLGVLIVVHEAGHYFVAKWCKMRVEKFSVGFGPPILRWKRGETQFQIAPILFGGFAQIAGMNPHEEVDPEDERTYPNRPAYQRFLAIFAGPATNILFSIFLAFPVFLVAGQRVESGRVIVSDVREAGVAVGKLQKGDVLVSVDGKPFTSKLALKALVAEAKERPMVFVVERDGKQLTTAITARHLPDGSYALGIGYGAELTRTALPAGQAVVESLRYPIAKSEQILGGLWDVITRKAPADAIGPVGMVTFISAQVDAGWIPLFELLAMLNVYLGLFNLLPLPALDGGRLVFLLYEMGTRRRPNPKVEATVHMAGFLLLFVVMILVTYKDIKSLFT